jgi:hypothetical protein
VAPASASRHSLNPSQEFGDRASGVDGWLPTRDQGAHVLPKNTSGEH